MFNPLKFTPMGKIEKALNWLVTVATAALALLPYIKDIIASKPF